MLLFCQNLWQIFFDILCCFLALVGVNFDKIRWNKLASFKFWHTQPFLFIKLVGFTNFHTVLRDLLLFFCRRCRIFCMSEFVDKCFLRVIHLRSNTMKLWKQQPISRNGDALVLLRRWAHKTRLKKTALWYVVGHYEPKVRIEVTEILSCILTAIGRWIKG